jgi:hypothetical protein
MRHLAVFQGGLCDFEEDFPCTTVHSESLRLALESDIFASI